MSFLSVQLPTTRSSIRPQDILVLHRVQCVRIPMKKLNYDRITTTIEREWLAEIIAGTKKIVQRGYRDRHFLGYCATVTAGGFHVPSRIEGGFSVGQ